VSPTKRSRKQRAADARRSIAIEAAKPRPKRDFLSGGQARVNAYLWAMCLTFGYGMVNTAILSRPGNRVNIEALAICVATLLFHVFLFYARSVSRKNEHAWSERVLRGLKHLKIAQIVRISALNVVLTLCAVAIGGVEPSIVARQLAKSDIGLIPGTDSDLSGTEPAYRFREVSARIEKNIERRVPGDPQAIGLTMDSLRRVYDSARLPENVSVAARLELAYLQSYATLSWIGAEDPSILHQLNSGSSTNMPVVIGQGVDKTQIILVPPASAFTEQYQGPKFFSSFSVVSFGHAPGHPIPQFAVTNHNVTNVVFNDIKIAGLAQDIGNLTWTNVSFVGCLIRYHGQPVRMGNVQFHDCTFEQSADGQGRTLLNFLKTHQNQPVSAYIP
jgi:hypothetical protein